MKKGNFWLSYKIRGQIVELVVQCICFDAVSRWWLKRYGSHVINGHQTLNILGISCLWTEQTNPCIKTLTLLTSVCNYSWTVSGAFVFHIVLLAITGIQLNKEKTKHDGVHYLCGVHYLYGVIPVYGTNQLLFIFCKSSFVQEEFVLFILEISWFTVSTKKNFTFHLRWFFNSIISYSTVKMLMVALWVCLPVNEV